MMLTVSGEENHQYLAGRHVESTQRCVFSILDRKVKIDENPYSYIPLVWYYIQYGTLETRFGGFVAGYTSSLPGKLLEF